jgi:ERCC4-related helicase
VDLVQDLIEAMGIKTIKVTGQVAQHQRAEDLDYFRNSDDQMVAILSNVGERDLDIPEADLLIVFDLIRTTKTVYQKLKRTRGGECRILYYEDTREERKVMKVLSKIRQKYHWSTKILPKESLVF